VLCLFLWSLDDYWYYSVFTLMMLMIFEGVMCTQRQNSVLMMRNMRRPPYKIFVFRCGQWMFHSTDTIFPGDIVSITADQTIYDSGSFHSLSAVSSPFFVVLFLSVFMFPLLCLPFSL
jgi:cation-transporting ATPase 13A1